VYVAAGAARPVRAADRGHRPVRAAVLWSGGKDSMLALHRAVTDAPAAGAGGAAGVRITALFNLFDGATGRVRFHGVRRELIAAQAAALQLDLLQLPTSMASFEAVFLDGLSRLRERGIGALVLGNIHLADVRAWYEERTVAAGLRHIEPLWGMPSRAVVDEVIGCGYRARITGIECATARRAWLGRDLDPGLAAAFEDAGIDAAGERGEYHTLVWDGPLFRSALPVANGRVHEADGFAFIDVLLAGSVPDHDQRKSSRVRPASSTTRPGRGKL
jgi:uncharacterized protein (TIGR00290 family)